MFTTEHRTRSGRIYNRMQCRRCEVLPALSARDAEDVRYFRLGLCAVCARTGMPFIERTLQIVSQARALGLDVPPEFTEAVWRWKKPMTPELFAEASRYLRRCLPHDRDLTRRPAFLTDVLGMYVDDDGYWRTNRAMCRHIPAEYANLLCREIRSVHVSHPLLNAICALTLEPSKLNEKDCGHGWCYHAMGVDEWMASYERTMQRSRRAAY